MQTARFVGYREEDGASLYELSEDIGEREARTAIIDRFSSLHTFFYGNEPLSRVVRSSKYPEIEEVIDRSYGPKYLDELLIERLSVEDFVSGQVRRTQGNADLIQTHSETAISCGVISNYVPGALWRLRAPCLNSQEWRNLDKLAQTSLYEEAQKLAAALNDYYLEYKRKDFRFIYAGESTNFFGDLVCGPKLIDCSFKPEDIISIVIRRRKQFEVACESAQVRILSREKIQNLRLIAQSFGRRISNRVRDTL